MEDRILHHADLFPEPPGSTKSLEGVRYLDFLRAFWKVSLLGPFPLEIRARGFVEAEINQGRWIVCCPNRCGGASSVPPPPALWVCVECGSPENMRQFYHVVFPEMKRAIEIELLRRPALTPWAAPTRNWKPPETVEDLRAEHMVNAREEA